MSNQAGDQMRCPRCNKIIEGYEIHQCYDPFGESYFNPSLYSPGLEKSLKSSEQVVEAINKLTATMNEIAETWKEISKRLKFIEDDLRRQK